MTSKILGGLVAALLLAPAVSFAAPPRTVEVKPDNAPSTTDSTGQLDKLKPTQTGLQPKPDSVDSTSLGTGMTFGNDPGHVASPSNTQVDPSTRGPLNDVQPGAPQSSDTAAARHPRPVRHSRR